MALEAAKKAYQLRQAAHGATNSQAREDALAAAVNKEIEAESFGKAAKYTRSGAFQGLAAGAGLGVQPGVTIGKLTGALVGGVVSSLGGVLAGGVGSVYGAINGPMWDLGQMAGKGVNSIAADWLPDWDVTSGQKKALEKMVMGAHNTEAPTQRELEEMQADNGGMDEMETAERDQWMTDMRGYIPNMPKMPNMPKVQMSNMPSMPSLGGWGFGGGQKQQATNTEPQQNHPAPRQRQANTSAKRTTPAIDNGKKQKRPKPPQQQPPNLQATPQASTTNAPEKKKPRKLETRSKSTATNKVAGEPTTTKRAPPKLQSKKPPAVAS